MGRTGLLAALAAAAGIGSAAVVLSNDHWDNKTVMAILGLAVGWSFVGSGIVARKERPESAIGTAMVISGFLWFAYLLEWSNDPLPFTIGTFIENAHLLAIAYIVVTFPDGRLRTRAERVVAAITVVLVAGPQLAWMLFADARAVICDECPDNVLQIARNDDLANAILSAHRALGIAVSAVLVVFLIRRWRRASAPLLRAAAPLLWTGSIAFVTILVAIVNDVLDEPVKGIPEIVAHVTHAAIPVAILAGLLRVRLARGAVADLVVELGGVREPGGLRDALARALGDPSLQVAYWLPERQVYVDAEGTAVDVPGGDGRAATTVERDGRRIAALVHDPALLDDPELVESATAAAALALENERLQAELRASLEDVRSSRARIVEAAEAERRRIERNLHDGTQQRLVSIAMALGLAEARMGDGDAARPMVREARESLSAALQELREISQGIHPSILTERGLGEALGELARRATVPVDVEVDLPRRPPPAVEAAGYYFVAEALTNVAKHAQARRARASATLVNGRAILEVGDDGIGGADRARGSGLRGLEDRVEALGGSLSVESPPGGGTVLRVELPCK